METLYDAIGATVAQFAENNPDLTDLEVAQSLSAYLADFLAAEDDDDEAEAELVAA
jgi:hypothetical protein